jgi:hypothetical protein
MGTYAKDIDWRLKVIKEIGLVSVKPYEALKGEPATQLDISAIYVIMGAATAIISTTISTRKSPQNGRDKLLDTQALFQVLPDKDPPPPIGKILDLTKVLATTVTEIWESPTHLDISTITGMSMVAASVTTFLTVWGIPNGGAKPNDEDKPSFALRMTIVAAVMAIIGAAMAAMLYHGAQSNLFCLMIAASITITVFLCYMAYG